MPRQKDVNDIITARRSFIKNEDWQTGEARSFYYTGYEKVQLVSKKSGKEYVQYYFYLLPIDSSTGKFGPEQTLGVFSDEAEAFKKSSVQDYQEIKVTKVTVPGKNGNREGYEVQLVNNTLPENERPAEPEYPEVKQYEEKGEASIVRPAAPASEDIDISDIPF